MTGIVFDLKMNLHQLDNHPESPFRTTAIIDELNKTGIMKKVKIVSSRKATNQELLMAHSQEYINLIKNSTPEFLEKKFKNNSVYFNKYSYDSACLAAGSVLRLTNQIIVDNVSNGFAITRPPGHHASTSSASGFCIFNNVAMAAIYATAFNKRVLVVDWDIHHGDGTEEILNGRENILFFSVQRYDNGKYYPATGKTKISENIIDLGITNVVGDNDLYYDIFINHLTTFKNFKPDIIIVSCGFDAVVGDPLGEYQLSPKCFGNLTRLLINVCPKILLVLEGGYNCEQIAKCSVECINALLNN